MGTIKSSRTLFFTTSPRSPHKLIPEIKLLVDSFSGQIWSGRAGCQKAFAEVLASASAFHGQTSKKYSEFSARDRITRSPQGLGFVDLSPTICLTDAGNEFIYGRRPHEIFFRQLLKFQIPSIYHSEAKKLKGTFWGHPYLEIIRLIRDLKFLSPDEFRIFALQLTDFRKYDEIKQAIVSFRKEKTRHAGAYKKFVDDTMTEEVMRIYSTEIESGQFATRQSKTTNAKSFIAKMKRNMKDYTDACFRCLRYTEMFLSDGRSLRIAPDKLEEIDYVLATVDRNPIFLNDKKRYKEYLFSSLEPRLLSDDRDKLEDTLMRFHSFTKRELAGKSIIELKDLRDEAVHRKRIAVVQEQERELKSYALYQEVVDTFDQIISEEIYDAPLFLEWNTWRAMTMLDGGRITGNFKVDDTGKPISTAQGNMPDIECDYDDFALSVEVTLQRGQRQYEAEGEPVTRHYANLSKQSGKETFCLFIAPTISKATWAHFFGLNQIKNIAAYGGTPKIVPLELDTFMKLVENSYTYAETPKPSDVRSFLQDAIKAIMQSEDENDWQKKIQNCVDYWLIA